MSAVPHTGRVPRELLRKTPVVGPIGTTAPLSTLRVADLALQGVGIALPHATDRGVASIAQNEPEVFPPAPVAALVKVLLEPGCHASTVDG